MTKCALQTQGHASCFILPPSNSSLMFADFSLLASPYLSHDAYSMRLFLSSSIKTLCLFRTFDIDNHELWPSEGKERQYSLEHDKIIIHTAIAPRKFSIRTDCNGWKKPVSLTSLRLFCRKSSIRIRSIVHFQAVVPLLCRLSQLRISRNNGLPRIGVLGHRLILLLFTSLSPF